LYTKVWILVVFCLWRENIYFSILI
jgi:hypothetical protein